MSNFKKTDVEKFLEEIKVMSDDQLFDGLMVLEMLIMALELKKLQGKEEEELPELIETDNKALAEIEKEIDLRKNMTYEQQRDRFFEIFKKDITKIPLELLKKKRVETEMKVKALPENVKLSEADQEDVKVLLKIFDDEIAKRTFKPTDEDFAKLLKDCLK